MIGVLLALLLGVALMAIVRLVDRRQGLAMLGIILGGYVLRLILQVFIREIPFFSHGLGGDSQGYEDMGAFIARTWRVIGVQFLTSEQIPELGPTALPANLFAFVIYLNGGDPSRLGCTAVLAFAGAITCFNLYHLAVEFGADPRTARRTMSLFYLGPTFVHYTSDTFKDGLVICFTVGALASGIRLMQRVSVVHIAIGLMSLWALWYVRFYLIFVTSAPVLVGLLGMRSKSILRPLFASLLLVASGIVLLALTDIAQEVSEKAAMTYEASTSQATRGSNAAGGSGVTFDDGGAQFNLLWLKILYTIFSPFPWASGSTGFQIGKIDVAIICFFIVRATLAAREKETALIFLMVLTFILPCTIMYATSMANVGLIVRQRMVIVICLAFLASLYQPVKDKVAARRPAGAKLDFRRGLGESSPAG